MPTPQELRALFMLDPSVVFLNHGSFGAVPRPCSRRSHITSVSAIALPVARRCAEARRLGILSIVDGAHAPGQVSLDLDAIGADVYVGNLHKWVCSPRGTAFVHARPELRASIRAPVVSWGWSWDGPEAFVERYRWQGTFDATAYLSIPAALSFRAKHDWPAVIAGCRGRLERTVAELESTLGGVPAAAVELRAPQLAAVHLDLGDREPGDVQRLLWERHRIEVPVERIGTLTVVRVSVQGYASGDDCRALVDALAAL